MSHSKMFTAGLVILGLLSVADLLGPVLTDGEHPPMAIALVGAALGLISLACIFGVRKGSQPALIALLVIRGLSALSAVPAFLVPEVPAAAKAAAGVGIAATLIGAAFVLGGRRVPAGAR
ncbi:hypothetical protein BH23ACT12_BH23ACT12_15170 [soil metagenome]